jgi:hypothetical protein
MKKIPHTDNPLVLRTDFSNQTAWETICAIIREPVGPGFRAAVEYVDDGAYAGITREQLLHLVPQNYPHDFIIVVDQTATTRPDYPLLIIDLYNVPGDAFRAIPSQIQGIENNLSLANMDFEEFASAVGVDGIFRGFRKG